MKVESLKDLLIYEISDMYNAEKQIIKALPKMVEVATNPMLKTAFEGHLKETENQVVRLEQIFKLLDVKIESEKCDALKGLIKEAEELMKHVKDNDVMDAALIMAAQKVEHYEIASYGSLAALADLLDYNDVAGILREILEEEKGVDSKLNNIALEGVNERALHSQPRAAE